jgi:SAM-dependent methyltransferase
MARNIQLRELLIGIEGLALLRQLYDGTDSDAALRLAEVRRLLEDKGFATGESISEADPQEGYRSWSSTYDEPGNPIIAIEEPQLWSLIEDLPPGRALDAASGTGRHARRLFELGHDVIGVDFSPKMLERARAGLPGAVFHEADLRHIPAEDGEFALVVCGLALAHVAELRAVVSELARVLATGGHLIVSALHPFQALLGWHAPFEDESGARRFVREYPHTHADYLDAFAGAGLLVQRCIEPRLSPAEVSTKRRAFRHIPDATLAAYVGLPAVLILSAEKTSPPGGRPQEGAP